MPTEIWATVAAISAAAVAVFAAVVAYWQARVTSRHAKRTERREERAAAAAFLESAAVLLERLDQATRSTDSPSFQHLYDLRAQMVSDFSRAKGVLAHPGLEASALRLYGSVEVLYQGWHQTVAYAALGTVDQKVVDSMARVLEQLADSGGTLEVSFKPTGETVADQLFWIVERTSAAARDHCHNCQEKLGVPALRFLQAQRRLLKSAPARPSAVGTEQIVPQRRDVS